LRIPENVVFFSVKKTTTKESKMKNKRNLLLYVNAQMRMESKRDEKTAINPIQIKDHGNGFVYTIDFGFDYLPVL